MAFDFFKKKEDDFSDFGSFDDSSKSKDVPHMGLPVDGDIANTSPSSSSDSFDPFKSNPGTPDSFNDLNSMRESQAPFNPSAQFQQSSQQNANNVHAQSIPINNSDKLASLEKDIQLVNVKVDAIRTVLESINNRLSNIEKIANDSQKKEETIRW
ncbi:MAG: hypothetical protein ACMXYG_03805 [Candidatus Woesearchaeota archaeon]